MSKPKQRRQKQQPKQHGPTQRPRAPRPKKGGGPPLWLPAAAVLVIVGVIIAVLILNRPQPPKPPPAHSNVVAQLTGVSASELDQVGAGSANTAHFKRVAEPALTAGGKPEVLYIGAEYCPYCAGERWALIVALSRFGAFSGVQTLTSSEGSLPTFTFHGSSYQSDYLSFVPVEGEDLNGNPLEKPTAAESALETKYASGIPFVDFGNRLVFDGATYDVSVLQGLDWQQVISEVKQPGSGPARGILGSANLITAGICELTGQQPGGVCSDPVIQGLEHQLPAS